jgi:hypothetical protein
VQSPGIGVPSFEVKLCSTADMDIREKPGLGADEPP